MLMKRITLLAALALLFTGNAGAGDVGLTGPTTVLVGSSADYKLIFRLSPVESAWNPRAWVRSPDGPWIKSTASMTTLPGPGLFRTTTVTKQVTFSSKGWWSVHILADIWTTDQPPTFVEERFGFKEVTAVTLPL